jgi:hypothetical protein
MKFYFPEGTRDGTSTCNACRLFILDQFTGVLSNGKHQCTNCGELHEVQMIDTSTFMKTDYTGVIFKKNMPSWYEKYPVVEEIE